MKFKKVIAVAMSLLCLSSVNIFAEAEENKEEIEIVESGVLCSAIPYDVMYAYGEYVILSYPEVQYEVLSNGVLRVFSLDEDYNSIPDGGLIHRLLGDACDIYGMKWSDLCKECTKLVIDDSIKTIGIGSFCGNDLSFDEVEIHCYKGGTTYVDEKAFQISNINKLTVYGEEIYFDDFAFMYSDVCTVDLSNCNNVQIGESAFEGCRELKSVIPAKNRVYIGNRAFRDCESLPSKMILSENTSEIRSGAFIGTNVTDVVMLNSKIKIEPWYEYKANVTIYGYKGSTAEEYVKSHADDNCVFVALDNIKGDVQTDAEINTSDAVLLQNYLIKKEILNEHQKEVADINNDGKINVFDLMVLKRNLE